MKKLLQQHIGLSHVSITKAETNQKGAIEITVESTLEGTHCHCCGQEITKFYDYNRLSTLRHLPLFGQDVYINHAF